MQKWIQPPACLDHGLHRILSTYWLAHYFWWKNLPKCCFILVLIAGCWSSLLTSRNPRNNWCHSCIFGACFSRKNHGLSTCKPWSKQDGGWIHFCMKRLRILNSYKIFKTNKKSKTYSGCCPFQGLYNVTTLMQIQSGRTVPLKILSIYTIWYGLSLKTILRYSPFIWWCRVMHMLTELISCNFLSRLLFLSTILLSLHPSFVSRWVFKRWLQ